VSSFLEITNSNWQRKNKTPFNILMAVWSVPGISRSDLAKRLEISRVAVAQSVGRLIDMGLLEETEEVSSKCGRRPATLRFRNGLFHSVGVSYSDGHKIKVCLTDVGTHVVREREAVLDSAACQAKCDHTIEMIADMLAESGIPGMSVAGIGISLNGVMNPETGAVISSPQFDQEPAFNIAECFLGKLGCPVSIINRPHLLALAEHRFGNARGMNSFLHVNDALSLGIFMEGHPCLGHQRQAGELGFVQVSDNGAPGMDGRVGLLGVVAGLWKLTERLDAVVAANGNTLVSKHLPPDVGKVTIDMVVEAIKEGDHLCSGMMSEHFQVIGKVLLNLAYIFNPEAIFLPPWVSGCEAYSLDIVRRQMAHYGVQHWGLKTDILAAACGDECLARAAALLPLDKLFRRWETIEKERRLT